MNEHRLPPHSLDAEEAVLGALLIDPEAMFDLSASLKPEAFYREQNRWIYEAMLQLYDRREPLDFLTLAQELRQMNRLEEAGGEAYLIDLVNAVPTSANVEAYSKIVEQSAMRRRMIQAASIIATLGYNEEEPLEVVLERAEQALFGVSEDRNMHGLQPVNQVAREFLETMDRLREMDEEFLGIPTGFVDLDRMLGGLNRSDLLIVAARPGMGKTSLMLSMALTAARRYGKRIAMFNLEMSADQLLTRLVAAETGIDAQRLRRGKIYEEEYPRFLEAVGRISETAIYIDDTPGVSPREMRAKCRRLAAERGLDLVMVDYLQLMEADHSTNNRVQEIGDISRGLKLLARELNVPVVAASQLSRSVESRQDKRPALSDLRDSGAIEQDADIVMFIYRDDYYNAQSERPGVAELGIAKHRNGPTGVVDLFWQSELATFRNLQRQKVEL